MRVAYLGGQGWKKVIPDMFEVASRRSWHKLFDFFKYIITII